MPNMASFRRGSWWKEALDREGVRSKFLLLTDLETLGKSLICVGLGFIHKIREMVQP